MSRKNRTERIIAGVVDRAEQGRKALRANLEGQDVGTSNVTDAEFAAWFEIKTGRMPVPQGADIQASPPQPFTHPEMPVQTIPWRDPNTDLLVPVQASFVMSPWELDLHFVEGGKDLLRRYERAVAKRNEREIASELEASRYSNGVGA